MLIAIRPSSPLTSVTVHRHLIATSSLSTLSPCAVHRPLSSLVVSPPPLSLRRVVPRPRRRGRLCSRSEGTAASPHPLASSRRWGKIPPVVIILRSDEDASRRPPPPPVVASSTAPTPVLLHPVSALIAPSNTCSFSHQRNIIVAPRRRRCPLPQPPPRRRTPKL
jgi:hypothetical protein